LSKEELPAVNKKTWTIFIVCIVGGTGFRLNNEVPKTVIEKCINLLVLNVVRVFQRWLVLVPVEHTFHHSQYSNQSSLEKLTKKICQLDP